MKQLLFGALLVGTFAWSNQAAEKNELKDLKDKASYSIGVNLGGQWKRQSVELDYDALLQGIKDSTVGNKLALTDTEMREVLGQFQTQIRAKQKEHAEKTRAEGEAWLAENKKKPGIKTTASGLQYKVLTEGQGTMPGTNDTVSVHYRGTLIDGTEFDSSFKRGQPATFPVTGVISGWTEALKMMKVGSKWELFIPSELAYKERGSQNIPPNSALIFEVELLSTKAPDPAPAAAATPGEPVTSDIIKVPSAEELKKGAKIEIIKKEDLEKQKQLNERDTK